MKKIIFIFFVFVLSILLINKMSSIFLVDRTSYELPNKLPVFSRFSLVPLMNFDGRNYLDISQKGYFNKDGHNLSVFFPVYPFLIRFLSINGFVNPVYVGLLISALSFFGILFLVNKMFGLKTLLLLISFPTAFFFMTFYTESLFLLLVLLFFYFLNKKNYLIASIFALVASGTRIMGLVLTPVLIYETIKYKKDFKKNILPILISPLGFVLYLSYTKMAIFSGQGDWNRQVGILGPLNAVIDSVKHILAGPLTTYDNNFVYPIITFEFVLFVLVVFVIFKMRKSIEMKYFLYSILNLVIILLGGSLASSPRYLLVIFPIFFYLAKKLKGVYYYIYLSISCLLFIVLSSLFFRGYWVA